MSYPVSYYTNLLTGEYAQSAKLQAFLSSLIQKLDDVSTCADSMVMDFDVDCAVGKQLDILGQIVGAKRVLPFQPSYGLSPNLEDEDYRILIKATIGSNHWDGLYGSLNTLWQFLFPSGLIVIQDNQNMTMDIFLTGNFSPIVIEMIKHGLIVPRPEGVLVNYYLGEAPLFGFDYDNQYVSGHDIGVWYSPDYAYSSTSAEIIDKDTGGTILDTDTGAAIIDTKE